MGKTSSLFRWGFLAAALLLVLEARATTIKIEIDTDALGLKGQNWDLAFDFIDGNSASNKASISSFAIPGGGLAGAPVLMGNVTGNLSGTVTFKDVDPADPSLPSFFNEYLDNANVGTLLSFILEISDNKDSGLDTDTFSLVFVNPTGTFPTTDPTGADAIFKYSIGNDDQPTSFCPITAPCVFATPVVLQAPEPGALALAVAALLALGFTRASRRIAARKAVAA